MSQSFKCEHCDLVLEQEPNGLCVTQGGSSYIARGWHLTENVKGIVEISLAAGLTSMIQRDHPRESGRLPSGTGVDYITFAPSDQHRWVFVLDMDSCPRRKNPTHVKFNKTYKHALRLAKIECPPEWRSTQNLTVALTDLPAALDAAAPHWERLGLQHGKAMERGLHDHFVDEEDLHAYILQNWRKIDKIRDLDYLATRKILGGYAHRQGEIDLLARDSNGLVVIELKNRTVYNTGGETPERQLIRYMTHPEIVSLAQGETIRGLLIAQEMDHRLRQAVRGSQHRITAFEATKTPDNGLILAEVSRSASA